MDDLVEAEYVMFKLRELEHDQSFCCAFFTVFALVAGGVAVFTEYTTKAVPAMLVFAAFGAVYSWLAWRSHEDFQDARDRYQDRLNAVTRRDVPRTAAD